MDAGGCAAAPQNAVGDGSSSAMDHGIQDTHFNLKHPVRYAVSSCPTCGKAIEPTWTFCGSCGAKIDADQSAAALPNDDDSAAAPTALFGTVSRESRMGSVVLTTVVVVLILAGSLWIGYQQEWPSTNAFEAVNPADSERDSLPAASGGQGRWSVERTSDPLTDTEVWTATSRVRSARQEMVVPIFGNPEREPQTISAIYEARFRLAPPASLEMTYTIYDALPTGTQFDGYGAYRELGVRFDDGDPMRRRWSISSEYPNVGSIRVVDPVTIAGTRRRILIQGLRAADEFIEFPIDASFEPFRAHLQRGIGDAERQRQAQETAVVREQEAAKAVEQRAVIDAQRALERGWMGSWSKSDCDQCPTLTIDPDWRVVLEITEGSCAGTIGGQIDASEIRRYGSDVPPVLSSVSV